MIHGAEVGETHLGIVCLTCVEKVFEHRKPERS